MIGFLRSLFSSTLGRLLTLGFVVLIALAFASADITGTGFGGVAGGDRAAKVGGTTIGTAALAQGISNAYDRARQQNPTLTMQQFLDSGAAERVLDDMIDRAALFEFGKRHGIVAGNRLVDSEIAQIPAFRGADGNFSDEAYRQLLQQQGLSDATVREDLAMGLVAKQLLVPAAFGAVMPRELALRYAALLKERRKGAIGLIPSAAFAPKEPPTGEALGAYYNSNKAAYTRPERRVIRYAAFGEEALKAVPAPTEAEVAKRYADNSATYAPSEMRTVTQVIVPTEAAARALIAEVRGGATLDRAAAAKGLSASRLEGLTRQALSAQASAQVAQAVFGAERGAIAAPARSGLGWHVIRVDATERKPGRTLDQARGEIVAQLTAEKRRTALSDLSARIEEQFSDGDSLADVARSLGLTPEQSEPLTAQGTIYGRPGVQAPELLGRLIPTAFAMEADGEPQLAEVVPGQRFVFFDVAQITPAAPAPLAEIRAQVAADWARAQGSAKAREAADRVLAQVRRGTALPAALGTIGASVPAAQSINLGREELTARQERVPPPLALLFSMAEGTAKRLEAPGGAGWYVIKLDDIEPGQVTAQDPLVQAAQRELGAVAGREYAEQLRRAIRAEVGVERNAAAIRAVRQQLTGGGQ